MRRPTPRRRRLLLAAATACVLASVAVAGWHGYRRAIGEPSARLADSWNQSQQVLDRHGAMLRDRPSALGVRGNNLPLGELGHRLVLATLVSEDKHFYEHGGVDGRALVRAVAQNTRHGRIVSGASTITQQLVKLLDAGGVPPIERDLGDKLREAARAQNLEGRLSKRAILEAYLNRLPYGRGQVGAAAAAKAFFGVRPAELSWAQAALLAVLPRAPTELDPYRHFERARRRQLTLLDALLEAGALDAADHARAVGEPLALRPIRHAFEAPHFVTALEQDGQLVAAAATQTTLDLALQHELETLADAHRGRLREHGAANAAAIVVDNASGEVLAYLGNADFGDAAEGGQIDMVRARRQPGSTLKPFAYALAFADGLSPAAVVADVPTRFAELGGAWMPDNFDGGFRGPISAREALAGSLNVPAVRIAASLPRGALLTLLRQLGIASLDRDAGHYGLALVLGSGEVTLFELAQAYAALARGGETILLKRTVADASNLGVDRSGERPLAHDVVAAVTDTLSDPSARLRGLGNRGPFDLGFDVAVKTGTSSGYRDSWTVGYTRELTIGVWVGNADGSPTKKLTGGDGAGPLFADAMRAAMAHLPVRRPLFDASLLEPVRVCPLSGAPVAEACPEAVTRRVPRSHGAAWRNGPARAHGDTCPLHRRAVRVQQGWRCDARGPATVVALPDSYGEWLASQPEGARGLDPNGLPWLLASALVGCNGAAPTLRIEEPTAGAVIVLPRGGDPAEHTVRVAASWGGATAGQRDRRLEVVLDGTPVAVLAPPYRAEVPVRRGDHRLGVRPVDERIAMVLPETQFSVR